MSPNFKATLSALCALALGATGLYLMVKTDHATAGGWLLVAAVLCVFQIVECSD